MSQTKEILILQNRYPFRVAAFEFATGALIANIVFALAFLVIPADSFLLQGPQWMVYGYFALPNLFTFVTAFLSYQEQKAATLRRLPNGDLLWQMHWLYSTEEQLPEAQIRLYKKRQLGWQKKLNITNVSVFALGHDQAALVIKGAPVELVEQFIPSQSEEVAC